MWWKRMNNGWEYAERVYEAEIVHKDTVFSLRSDWFRPIISDDHGLVWNICSIEVSRWMLIYVVVE